MRPSTTFTSEQEQRMCALRNKGKSNATIAAALGLSRSVVKAKLCRLAAQGRCKSFGPGRPSKHVATRGVSPRFTEQVAEILREVAGAAGMRIGLVTEHALERRISNDRSKPPFGLEPGKREKIRVHDPRLLAVISPKLPVDLLDRAERDERKRARAEKREPLKLNSIIAEACLDLLEDLNYEFVGDSAKPC